MSHASAAELGEGGDGSLLVARDEHAVRLVSQHPGNGFSLSPIIRGELFAVKLKEDLPGRVFPVENDLKAGEQLSPLCRAARK